MDGKSLAPQVGQRAMDIDIARTIAALLVILEHILDFFPRYGMHVFYTNFNHDASYVLKFIHISIFITIAGILAGLSRRQVNGIGQYARFEQKKFLRLMLPYFSIATLQLLIKMFVPGRGLSEAPSAVLGTLVAPHGGAMPHGWFLVSLMTIFLLWPLMKPLAEGKSFGILLCSLIVVAIIPIPWPEYQGVIQGKICRWPYFDLKRTTWYLPIFVIGFWYGRHVYTQKMPRLWTVFLAGMAFLIAILTYSLTPWPNGVGWLTVSEAIKWAGYLSAGFVVLWLCGIWCRKPGRPQTYLARIGRFSYDVYLLQVIVGHVIVLSVSRFHPGNVLTYILLGAIVITTFLTTMGVGQLIRRSPALAFIVLGEP